MEEILVIIAGSVDPLYVAIWCFICLIFTAVAPPQLTTKIPNLLMRVINFSAFNWGNAVNKYTDSKGNQVNESTSKTSTDTGKDSQSSHPKKE